MGMTNKKLRHNEYYNFSKTQDWLYEKSLRGENFKNLYKVITREDNILLAYRNIKSNSGSFTAGMDNKTIADIQKLDKASFVEKIQKKMRNYHPGKVKRVHISKADGSKRPLGIPTIEDRIIQQCFKQVLEPICEAKFYSHSYGFRPNRSTHHAISRCVSLVNINKLYYCVDIDIKGFFDNINHNKLIKQLWSLGIKDKRVIKLVRLMLNAEIAGEGIPTKGVPQGGVLSPLLSNIVLNELDWWIASQFHEHPTRHNYVDYRKKFRALKDTNLKEVFIVRYADDFKIFCRNHRDATNIFIATQKWLKNRLGLDCNTDKSKVTNLRRSSTDFLGYSIKAMRKKTTRGEYVAKTTMSDKKRAQISNNIRDKVKDIKRHNVVKGFQYEKAIKNYNSLILGLHEYFQYATHCYLDFARIKYDTYKLWYHRLKLRANLAKDGPGEDETSIRGLYPDYEGQLFNIQGITLYPITGIKHKNPKNFSQDTCNYTVKGRARIHKELSFNVSDYAAYILRNRAGMEIDLIDKQISLYAQQKGKCSLTGNILTGTNSALHHKVPKVHNGSNDYQNLCLVLKDAHILIHATKTGTIETYLKRLKLNPKQVRKLNKYRTTANLTPLPG